MTRTLYEFTGLPAQTSKDELIGAVEALMNAAFSEAAMGVEKALKELAELRYSYLLWAYGDEKSMNMPLPAAGELPSRHDGPHQGGERRHQARRERETVASGGLRYLADRRSGERRSGEYSGCGRFAPAHGSRFAAPGRFN